MKANDAPRKIYIPTAGDEIHYHMTCPKNEFKESIEYSRTDAFIEKAVKWIDEINNHHHIMRYSDSCEPPLIELTEWFKNYMKEE